MRLHEPILNRDELNEYRASVDSQRDLALAPTIMRELRASHAWRLDPAVYREVETPVLMLVGGDSPPAVAQATDFAHAALTRSSVAVLHGHGHIAMWTEPQLGADRIIELLSSEVPGRG
jgi:pimeloyl-ACP methyl ester carboxylesterase